MHTIEIVSLGESPFNVDMKMPVINIYKLSLKILYWTREIPEIKKWLNNSTAVQLKLSLVLMWTLSHYFHSKKTILFLFLLWLQTLSSFSISDSEHLHKNLKTGPVELESVFQTSLLCFKRSSAVHCWKGEHLKVLSKNNQDYLAIVRNGFFIFFYDVFRTQAVLGTSYLSTGICIYPIGSQST